MINSKSFLAVDFGAGSLKLAEFEVNEAGGLRLKSYAIKPLGPEGAQEASRDAVITKALEELITQNAIKAKTVNVCPPGFHVFSKFVKLPPVDPSKVTQIIQYEAQQNVPFPLEEVVWDYQILGSYPSGELEVLLVAIKAEVIEGLFRTTESLGLHLEVADVSPAALCNAFRYNYGDIEECTMLLDIGAKTSNLLFFEKGKVFSRSINLGANSITQDFANESKKKFDLAEKIKIQEGFVSLGGAYEEPENPDQAAISKIARQFMTRLHIQVNQTMQFYRGQQAGSAPVRLFLSGGASIMPYTAQFFAEKLNVPVEYFNPLRNVQIDETINLEELARVAHSLGEVVGLGLRNLAHCPIELNLMPESTLQWQSFNQKKPYFIATVFSLVAVVAAIGFLYGQLAQIKNKAFEEIHPTVEQAQARSAQFKSAYRNLQSTEKELDRLTTWMDDRYYWADVLSELRQILLRVETSTRAKLRTETGVWIEQFISGPRATGEIVVNPYLTQGPEAPLPSGGLTPMQLELFKRRYLMRRPMVGPDGVPLESPAMPPSDIATPPTPDLAAGGTNSAAGATPKDTNSVSTVSVTFRAISLSRVSAPANTETAFAVLNELRKSPLFDAKETEFSGNISNDEPPGTFTFGVNIKLKRPLKL